MFLVPISDFAMAVFDFPAFRARVFVVVNFAVFWRVFV
jgi:hypothetical protein